ncbi:MAG: creatininase family protein [Candidatus Nitrosopolaris sp.]
MINGFPRILEEMNAIQLRKNLNSKTVAMLVFGACENHGDHMPFGSDFFVPMELAKRVAARAGNVLVLPAFPYGVSSHHSDFQMTITLEPRTMIMAIEDICSSLIKNGINRILIINGHDGNIAPIELSARTIKDRYPNVVIACLEAWWTLVGKTKNLFGEWAGLGHGGEAETSMMLSVRPDLVDMKSAPKKTIPKLPRNVRIYWRFSELTKTGATGAPRHASRSKGDETLHTLERLLLGFINNMEKNNWKYGLALK